MKSKLWRLSAAGLAAVLAVGTPASAAQVDGAGTLEEPRVTVTETASTDPENGAVTTVTVTVTDAAGTDEDGAAVQWQETRTETTVHSAGGLRESFWEVSGERTQTKMQTEPAALTVVLQPGGTAEAAEDAAEPEAETVAAGSRTETRTVSRTQRRLTAVMGDAAVTRTDGGSEAMESLLPVWSDAKQYVKPPARKLTDEELAAAEAARPAGYRFLYIGTGEDSLFGATYGFVKGEETAENWVTGTNQFQLSDSEMIHTAYCVDLDTTAKPGYWYTLENLEDAGYYKAEGAEEHVRAIVNNGYWGTADGTGSLGLLKEKLRAAGGLSDEDVDALTEGEALAATQIAVWRYGNPYDSITLSANTGDGWYINASGNRVFGWADLGNMTTEERKAALARINALADYLAGLSQTEDGSTELISPEKFVEDLRLTVGATDHVAENGGTVYRTELAFTLAVTPDGEKDDLVLRITDGTGGLLRQVRLAGTCAEGETLLEPDGDGWYELEDLRLTAEEFTGLTLELEGSQHVEQGVYIYTSETRDGVPSQTFVGIAEGKRAVAVSMETNVRFAVEESIVTTRTVWNDSGRTLPQIGPEGPDLPDVPTGPETPENPGPSADPELPAVPEKQPEKEPEEAPKEEASAEDGITVPEQVEEVPPQEVPKTGDAFGVWLALWGVSGAGLFCALLLKRRKRLVK